MRKKSYIGKGKETCKICGFACTIACKALNCENNTQKNGVKQPAHKSNREKLNKKYPNLNREPVDCSVENQGFQH